MRDVVFPTSKKGRNKRRYGKFPMRSCNTVLLELTSLMPNKLIHTFFLVFTEVPSRYLVGSR